MSSPRRAFFSPELALTVSPASLQLLLDAAGDPTPLPAEPLARARLLWDGPWSPAFCDALEKLAWFGTCAGREAFLEAAHERGRAMRAWEDVAPLDLAARLLASPDEHEDVLLRARIRLSRYLPERSTYELVGAAPRRIGATDALRCSLASLASLASIAGGHRLEPWIHEEDDGTIHAVVLTSALVEAIPDVGVDGVTTRAIHALRADAFHLLPAVARLAITTARPTRVEAYAAAWGEALYGDRSFFARRPSVTLKPLLLLAAGIDASALPKGVTRASVITVQLDKGDGRRREERGPDALQAVLRVAHARGGYLSRVTIRFEIEGESRPVDAVLELPNKVHLGAAPSSRAARLVREALGKVGLLSPGALEDDITTLLPGVQAAWRVTSLVGDEGLATMTKAKLLELVPGTETRRPARSDLRHMGRGAVAFPLRPRVPAPGVTAAYYVVSEDWAIPAVTLTADDMSMYRLLPAKLAAQARRELRLRRGKKPILPSGVLWIGELQVPSGVARFVYVMRAVVGEAEQRSVGHAIARAVGFGRAVVLVPAGRRMRRDFVELELSIEQQLGAASWHPLLEAAARELGVLDEIPIDRLAPPGARVLVDVARQRVSLDGEPLTHLGESGYRLVKFLADHAAQVAERRGHAVSTAEVHAVTADTDAAISGNRNAEGTTRTAVYKMKAWVRESFADAGKRLPKEVARDGLVSFVPKKGWRLAYPAWIKR